MLFDIQYKKSAKLDDMLLIKTKLMGIKKCSLLLEQTIHRDKELLISSNITVACVDAKKFSPLTIPINIKKLMETT